MKNKILYQIFLICVLSSAYVMQAHGQDFTNLSGKIVNNNGEPISGAVIFIQEGNKSYTTDFEGSFNLEVDASINDFLLINAKGYNDTLISSAILLNNEDGVTIELTKPNFHLGTDDIVNLPFGQLKKRHIVGSVSSIKMKDVIEKDAGTSIYRDDYVVLDRSGNNAVYGRIPGLFGTTNIHRLGGATVVIDGVPRADYSLNIQEIEEISVLKDPTSRILYGAQADRGVIYITTKRGTPYKRLLNVYAESGVNVPISYPKYLNSLEYMQLYNEACLNDGVTEKYTPEQITSAQNGVSILDSPDGVADEDYYNSDYLNDYTNFLKLNAEASGGNDKAQYYANLGWLRGNSLLNLGEETDANYNSFSIRGNVDYHVNDYIKTNLDVVSSYSFNRSANSGQGFWYNSTTLLPNQYPLLIPVDSLSGEFAEKAIPVDGNVFGGATGFTNNIYGDLTSSGYKISNQYFVQFNSGIEINLDPLVKGLTAKASVTFDFFNLNELFLNKDYAVYEVSWDTNSVGADSIVFDRLTEDDPESRQQINGIFFQRRLGFYGTLNYDRRFGVHNISATGVVYTDQYKQQGQFFSIKNLTMGGRLNYAYNDKYIAEFGGAIVGSGKLPEDNRFAFSPSVGAAWVLSEEDFMLGISAIDYLKVKASAGRLLNDRMQNNIYNDYYLYETSLQRAGNYQWNDALSSITNNRYVIQTIGNPILDWTTRDEVVIGFEANFLGSLWLSADYYQSTLKGQVTQRNNTQPALLGVYPYENYDDDKFSGVDVGIVYTEKFADLTIDLGINVSYAVSEVLKIDEPVYEYGHLSAVGESTTAIRGLEADGLYQESDFELIDYENQIFTLRDGVVSSDFSIVQPGDIKYVDKTNDNKIDENDEVVIGNSSPNLQFAIPLTLKYKNIELYVLGMVQRGQSRRSTNPYYQVYGDRKYSEVVNDRYHHENNPTGTYPRLTTKGNNNNYRLSSYWLYDNNWFGIETAQLSFSLPQLLSRRIYMDNLRLYVRGTNLLMIAENKDISQLNIGYVPQMRVFSGGLSVTF